MPARAASSPRRPRWNPTFGNPSWDEASVRILVARLSPFSVAERSSTHLELCYEARRGAPRAYLDLVFYPEVGAEAEAGGPRSLHGSRRPRDFDLILLSNSYLLELLNVPRFLEESGIPLEARERRHGDPVLILGGANATAASALAEPVGGASGQAGGWAGAWASYVDAFFFGEGEAQVRLIAACFERARGEGRRRALAELEREVGAIWAPRLPGEEPGRAPRRAVAGPVGLEDIPTDYPVLDGEEAATARLQITWGCPALCSFCF